MKPETHVNNNKKLVPTLQKTLSTWPLKKEATSSFETSGIPQTKVQRHIQGVRNQLCRCENLDTRKLHLTHNHQSGKVV
jgi:hypothetical protein